MSPTTVIEPLNERRVVILSCIGVRSCTSSITMWPYVRISSNSSILPCLPGLGPSTSRASSSRATSAALQRTSWTDSLRARYNDRYSRSSSTPSAASRSNPVDPNRSCNSSAGVSSGQIRSSASRISGNERTSARTSRAVASPERHVSAIEAQISPSTYLRALLWRRKRRRAWRTMRAVSSARRRMYPDRNGTTRSDRSARSRSVIALSMTSLMRASPLTRAVRADSAGSLRVAKVTSGTRSDSTTCSTPASPSDGSTCSMYLRNTRFGPITSTP